MAVTLQRIIPFMLNFGIGHRIFQKPFFHEKTQTRIGKNHVRKKSSKIQYNIDFGQDLFFSSNSC